jgi:hypothetical protein
MREDASQVVIFEMGGNCQLYVLVMDDIPLNIRIQFLLIEMPILKIPLIKLLFSNVNRFLPTLKAFQKTLSTTVFLYFACILPAIALGVLNAHNTGEAVVAYNIEERDFSWIHLFCIQMAADLVTSMSCVLAKFETH